MKLLKKIGLFLFLLIAFAIYQGSYADKSVEELKVKYANQHSKFIEVDGMQVHYRDEGTGFPIVLLHGTAASLHTWDAWTNELKNNYRIIRVDLPAFGLTGPNSSADYSIKNYVSFLEKFIKMMKIEHFHLAGNSLGGNIAWNYASQYPSKVNKLILIDASGIPSNKKSPLVFQLAKTPILNDVFLWFTPKLFIKKNLKEVYANDTKISDNLVTRYHDLALREGNRKAFIDRAKTDFTKGSNINIEKLKNLQSTTLLIWGAKDTWISLSDGKKMDLSIPNSKLVVLENSGHVPMEENPKETLQVVKAFLSE